MIDQTIVTPLRFPIGALLCGLATVGLVAIAAGTGNAHVAVAALLPGLYTLVLLLGRRPAFRARVTEDGVELSHPPSLVRFDEIEKVLTPSGAYNDDRDMESASFAIRVYHERGFFTIPAGLNVSSRDVWQLLQSRAGGKTSSPTRINPELRDYLRRQLQVFGPEKVRVYVARDRLTPLTSGHIGRRVGLATLATGVVWVIVGAAIPEPGWIAAGVMAVLFGALFALLFWLAGRTANAKVRNWREAGLIISPEGLALIQGDLRGELHWEEIRDVTYRTKPASFALTPGQAAAGIVLTVEGATIRIADIYHRPLKEIHEHVMDYWE
jgi:hypothetical protein